MANLTKTEESYIDHEVRVRILEDIAKKIDERFDKLDEKIDSHFKWMLGILFALFGAVLLTKLF